MSNHSTLEERLSRSLDQQATALHDAPFTLDDVRGRARGIQRRRRGVAAGVVAVVAAIAVPVALLAGPGSDRTEGVDPAPRPTTAAASVLHAGQLTLPDGRTVDVDLPSNVTQVGVLGDGRIVAPVNSGGGRIRVLSPQGEWIDDYPVMDTMLTMGVDDQAVAWIDPDYRVQVLESGVDEPVTFPGVPMPGEAVGSIDAVLGSDCAAGGCTVLAGDHEVTTHRITLDGATPLETAEPFRVRDVSPDGRTWAVTLARDVDREQFGCAALYDVEAGAVTARNCDTTLIGFSLDGRHVTATRSDGGPFLGEPSILDLGLREVGRVSHPDGVVSSLGWEDAEHLLVSVADWDGAAWSLLRVNLDGTTDAVLEGPAAGELPEIAPEYLITG